MNREERVLSYRGLSRHALYERVWSMPTRNVAERIGVSNVALARACHQLQVPLPSRGYWARVQHGHKVTKPALPPFQVALSSRKLPLVQHDEVDGETSPAPEQDLCPDSSEFRPPREHDNIGRTVTLDLTEWLFEALSTEAARINIPLDAMTKVILAEHFKSG